MAKPTKPELPDVIYVRRGGGLAAADTIEMCLGTSESARIGVYHLQSIYDAKRVVVLSAEESDGE